MAHDPLAEWERVTAMKATSGALQITAASSRAIQEHHDKCSTCSAHRECERLHRLLVGEIEAHRILVQAVTDYHAALAVSPL